MQVNAARMALPIVLALMTICPALGIVLTGRDVSTFRSLEPLAPSALAVWVLRLGTLTAVAAMLIAMLGIPGLGFSTKARPRQLTLLAAFLAFFTTNYIIPGFLGTVPSHGLRAYGYTFLLFLALYAARDHGSEALIAGTKWSLSAFMLASIVLAFVWPSATLRPYADELRLPLVPFRFWGLGSSPNSIGPLALTLLLLLIVQPFARRWLQITACLSAAAVVLLAQSQTTWIAAALIVPPLLLYRRRLARHGPGGLAPPPGLSLAMIGLATAALSILLTEAASLELPRVSPTGGIAGADDILTGRGSIWRVALDVFTANPLFGYGLAIWEDEFRAAIGMSFAVHAHNQLIQSLAMGGIVAAVGLLIYVAAVIHGSLASAAATGGLAPALMVMTLFRMITEVPFQMQTLLVGDALMHALLFAVVVSARPVHSAASSVRAATAPSHMTWGARGLSGRPRRLA
ncbi:MAG: O-antigen ligase family protein [Hyphomicrobiaceae bacterium]|nr:O-antigen ligase family protein [Hyphomicrobiaceae bacterium]